MILPASFSIIHAVEHVSMGTTCMQSNPASNIKRNRMMMPVMDCKQIKNYEGESKRGQLMSEELSIYTQQTELKDSKLNIIKKNGQN